MILAFGGEMGFFSPADANTIENASLGGDESDSYSTTFARCATRSNNETSYAETPDIGSVLTTAWIHFQIEIGAAPAFSGYRTLFVWKDNAGTERIRIQHDPTNYNTILQHYNGSWNTIGAAFTINMQSYQVFDLLVTCNSASGSVRLFTSGTERIGTTVNTTAIAQLNKARFSGWSWASPVSARTSVSEVVIADEATVGMRVMTYYVTGTGNDFAWTGTYADVDEIPFADADFINSTVAGDVELFTGTPVSSIASLNIRAVCVTARARRGASGPQNIQLALRTGGTNYFSGTQALDVGYKGHVAVWETNPFTAAAWTAADAAAIEFGVKSIA